MGKVILDMSMSLDGFIADRNGEDAGLHNWYFAPSGRSAEVIKDAISTFGAIVMGRRTYDLGAKYDGFVDSPYQAANFVLSHHAPEKRAKGAEAFIFVTDGIESALQQAKAAAADKDVALGGGANIAQQCLKAGLIDEIQLHLVPLLLGEGIRLFENLGINPVELESANVIETPAVTHITFRVVK